MSNTRVATRGRIIALTLDGATISPRWWTQVKIRRRGKARAGNTNPLPAVPDRVHIPAKAVRSVTFVPARRCWPGVLVIRAPGYGDPWSWRARFHRKGGCPHRIRFGRRKECAVMGIAKIVADSL